MAEGGRFVIDHAGPTWNGLLRIVEQVGEGG
jgi:hypothetical protein